MIIERVSIPLRQAKNGRRLMGSKKRNSFQFLLGRLKTISSVILSNFHVLVSIPLRQAKNYQHTSDCLYRQHVSIPLRQAKNIIHYYFPPSFFGVSIPLRQAKNYFQYLITCLFFVFQFLLGRLKTKYR